MLLSRLRAQKTRTRQAPLVVVVCMGVYSSGIKSADRIKQIRADGWYLMHVVGSHHQFKHLGLIRKLESCSKSLVMRRRRCVWPKCMPIRGK